jgi:rubrerythrin
MNYYDPYNYGQQQTTYGMQQTMAMPAMAQQQPAQADNIFTYPQNLPGALSLIQQAVAGETEDRMFYTYLMDKAPSAEDKEIISGIRNNEISHP